MAEGYYRELIKILKKHGCYCIRQAKGSHEMWRSPINNVAFPIAVTIGSKILANKILKHAGIDKKHHF